jgi:Mg2+ and Co2+ transporter CorA
METITVGVKEILDTPFTQEDYRNGIESQRFPNRKEVLHMKSELGRHKTTDNSQAKIIERRYRRVISGRVSLVLLDEVTNEQSNILARMEQQALEDPELEDKVRKQRERVEDLRMRRQEIVEEPKDTVPPVTAEAEKERAMREKLIQIKRRIETEKSHSVTDSGVRKIVGSAKEMGSIIDEQMRVLEISTGEGEEEDEDFDLLSIANQKHK